MKTRKTEIKWALIFVVFTLLWMLAEKLSGLHDAYIETHAVVTNIFALPAILIYVLALLDKRKNDYGGFMSYGQGFISGLLISLIVTVLSPATQYLTVEVISPDYFKNMIEHAVENGLMEREAAAAEFNLNNYLIISLIMTPLMGIATTAIVALFVKKSPR